MSAAGRAALEMDELLTRLDPADKARIRTYLDAVGDPLADQVEAASREAFTALRDGPRSASRFEPLRQVAADQVPQWVRLQALELLVSFTVGEAATCQHGPSPTRPEPLQGSAWRPGLIACWRCPHLFRLPKSKDCICDHCGTDAGLIYPSVVLVGPLAFAFGLCPPCHQEWQQLHPTRQEEA